MAVTSLALLLETTSPARADFAAGVEAYEAGDFGSAAREWRGPARQGVAVAEFNLGILYYQGLGVAQDRERGRQLWLSAASHGYIPAFYDLALTEMDGYLSKPDFEDARVFLEQAANAGYAPAQYFLANLLRLGLGGDKDFYGAMSLYQQAAQGGNADAAFTLGEFARLGTEIASPSPADAFLWYEAAAQKGYARAEYRLGHCFLEGFGTAPDATQAYVWLTAASAHGHVRAEADRQTLMGSLTPEQLDAANMQLEAMGVPLPADQESDEELAPDSQDPSVQGDTTTTTGR